MQSPIFFNFFSTSIRTLSVVNNKRTFSTAKINPFANVQPIKAKVIATSETITQPSKHKIVVDDQSTVELPVNPLILLQLKKLSVMDVARIYFKFFKSAHNRSVRSNIPAGLTKTFLASFFSIVFPQHYSAATGDVLSFPDYQDYTYGINTETVLAEKIDSSYITRAQLNRLTVNDLIKALVYKRRNVPLKSLGRYGDLSLNSSVEDITMYFEATYPLHYYCFCRVDDYENWSPNNYRVNLELFWANYNYYISPFAIVSKTVPTIPTILTTPNAPTVPTTPIEAEFNESTESAPSLFKKDL